MKIAYCSLLLPEEKHLAERAKKRLSGISLHKFTRALISGLDSNLSEPVTIFNIINTLNYPNFPQLIFRNEQWHHTKQSKDYHIGYINLFGIKYITQERNLYKHLKRWVLSNRTEDCMICVHHIYYPSMKAAVKIKKKFNNVKICLVTGDMNGKYGLQSQYKKNLKHYLTTKLENKIDNLATKFDCFVFATKYMAEAFGVDKKPFTVVECAYKPYDYSNDIIKEKNENKKILFYAGAVRKEYGLEHLLSTFTLINKDNYILQIAGDGNAVPLVREYASKNSNVQFLGFITPEEVDSKQKEATVIVSPRQTNLEFVKYSFPSKSLDSLASGTPYIAHKLPCDPLEYGSVIQYAEDETDQALARKIIEICELPSPERIELGKAAIKFINEQKNPTVMAKKVVDLWNEVFNKKI